MATDTWAQGEAYEAFIGRWSRIVADVFVRWLDQPAKLRWLDAGCGTGALAATVVELADPGQVVGADPAWGFLASGSRQSGVTFCAADAQALPFAHKSFDVVVSALAVNFVPDPHRAAAEFARVSHGCVAAYVWDYADGMRMLRYFWDAATELEPSAARLDEASRFPICRPEPLRQLWIDAGLFDVSVEAIEVPTKFENFDDFWQPFLGGQGPAPTFAMSLTEQRRDALRERIRELLPHNADGSIALTARAWAVRGRSR